MRILIFGPPGAGKGTQAGRLVNEFGLVHISTGVMLRDAIDSGSELGLIAKQFIDDGKLVPGSLIRGLVESAIEACGLDNFILDGYPRTEEQAEWLDLFLLERGIHLDAVISLKVPDEEIVNRLSKRRVNRVTGENYHLDYNPPPTDLAEDMIVQRKDDRADAILRRLGIYHRQTAPVEAHYVDWPIYFRVDGTNTFDGVFQSMVDIVTSVASS